MDNNILISIIVPVYNTRKFLNNCIKSVINQDFNNFELILVDDGSTDGSCLICKKFAKKYKFIRLVSQSNGGVSKARNTGISLAKGKYITFLDADDSLEKDSLKELFFEAENNNSDIVIGSYNRIRFSQKVGKIIREKDCIPKKEFWKNIDKYERYISTPWAKLYKTEIIKKNGLLFEIGRTIGEDAKFNRQYLQYVNSNIIVSNKIVYNYRMGGLASTVVYHKDINILKKDVLYEYIDYNKKNNYDFYNIEKRASKQIYECFKEHIIHHSAFHAAKKIEETMNIYNAFFEEKYISKYISSEEINLLNKKLYIQFVKKFRQKRYIWYIKKKSIIIVRRFYASLLGRL